jgi:hypothetical protein
MVVLPPASPGGSAPPEPAGSSVCSACQQRACRAQRRHPCCSIHLIPASTTAFLPAGAAADCATACCCLQAMRLTMVQVLINSKGLNMNPIQSLYYVSPACFICLAVPFRECLTTARCTTLHCTHPMHAGTITLAQRTCDVATRCMPHMAALTIAQHQHTEPACVHWHHTHATQQLHSSSRPALGIRTNGRTVYPIHACALRSAPCTLHPAPCAVPC